MAKQVHLPDELLKQIFSYLQPPPPKTLGRARYEHMQFVDEDAPAVCRYTAASDAEYRPKLKNDDDQHKVGISTLSRCTCVCKLFERIVRPMLYEHFPGQPIAGLQAFNRTLVRRPDLARMVKYLTIGGWIINMTDGLERWWKSTVKEVGLGQKLLPALLKKAEAGHEDAQVALILFLCTSVHTIDLSVPVLLHMSLVKSLIKEVAQDRPNTLFRGEDSGLAPTVPLALPLRNLRSVSLRHADTSLSVSVSAYDVLLRLPTVAHVTLHRLCCDRNEKLPPMPQLQKLCLWRCRLDEHFWKSLKVCKGLRSLEVIWPGMSIDYMQNVYPLKTSIDYRAIGQVISETFPSLEKLVLDPREACLFGESYTVQHSLDLSSLKNLKRLTVERRALWSMRAIEDCPSMDLETALPRLQDILPPSITKLAILFDRHATLEEISTPKMSHTLMLKGCLQYLALAPSNLQSVHLDMPYPHCTLDLYLDDVGFEHSAVTADSEVRRAGPVVGTSTPKDQRAKLREAFRMWFPDIGEWSTVVFNRSAVSMEKADLSA